jgi:hypothetical protein
LRDELKSVDLEDNMDQPKRSKFGFSILVDKTGGLMTLMLIDPRLKVIFFD